MKRILSLILVIAGCDGARIPASGPECANGVREGTEQCDTGDLGGQSCLSLGFLAGGVLACDAACAFDTSDCLEIETTCQDGVAQGDEQCDGDDLRHMTCRLLGYDSPLTDVVTCAADCTFDVSGCTATAPECGNDNAEGLEECDGFDLRGLTCADFGYESGILACDSSCRLSRQDCTGGTPAYCGDGVANGLEECDGADLRDATCTSLGYTGTGATCDAFCRLDVSACVGPGPVCGNGVREGEEACDGSDGYQLCEFYGLSGGLEPLPCDASCTPDLSSCDAPHCGDGAINVAGEVCDGADVGADTCEAHDYVSGELACAADCRGVVFSLCEGGTSTCGNGIVEPDEMCDGSSPGLYGDCEDIGFGAGTVACFPNCLVDLSPCAPPPSGTCGNGVVEDGEQCDGSATYPCPSHHPNGVMTCNDNCSLNASACTT